MGLVEIDSKTKKKNQLLDPLVMCMDEASEEDLIRIKVCSDQ